MIAIVTPGAVGGLLAALLERAGTPVTLVARPESVDALRADGLTVRSGRYGNFTAHPPVATAPPAGSDVLLAVKAYGLPDVLPGIAAAEPGEVLTLLNGLEHVDQLRRAGGIEAVAGAAIGVEVVRIDEGPDRIIDHRSDFLTITVPEHAGSWRVTEALRGAGVEVKVGGSEEAVLWTKLRMLAPLALLTSYWRAPLGEARERDPDLTEGLIAEVAAVATAGGVPTDAARLSRTIHNIHAEMRSSMQHDMAAERATELEHIGGAVQRAAREPREAAQATPHLDRVLDELRQRLESTSR
ncbi:MAG TPA: 2-dehydropantoate 2-reductase [Actinomycetaceae bacterium]|nr:2-dehydropantoate 2-reductase [Actinomycetaceae bacterium]